MPSVGRKLNAIERVRNRLNQLARRPVWKLSVGIERDHVANSGRQHSCVREDAGFLAIQQTVEFLELPAFPLPSDPAPLRLAPDPHPVKEDEGAFAVSGVKFFDTFYRQSQQRVVFGHLGFFRVVEICQKREMEIRFGVGEVPHLQFLDLSPNRVRRQEHHWHDHQGSALLRYAFFKRHFG